MGTSVTEQSDTWAVSSASGCLTYQLTVDEETAGRLATDERAEWQHVVPTPISAVHLVASGCCF